MANYKQVTAFCYNCNRQVVAQKEEVDHIFWLIASLFSCGIFAIVWIIKMLTHNPPAMCSQCGLAIGNNPQMQNAPQVNQANQTNNSKCGKCGLTNFAIATVCKRCNTPLSKAQPSRVNFMPQNSDEATGKGLSPAAKFAIASVIGVFAMLVLIRIVGDVSSVTKQPATVSQAPQSAVTPQATPNPIQQTKNVKGKEASPTKQVEGFRMKDDDGTLRGYSLACHRQANELGQDVDIKVRVFVFERCIQLEGDGDTAKREAIYLIRQTQGK